MKEMISGNKDVRKVEPRSRSVGAESRNVGARYEHFTTLVTSALLIIDQRGQMQDIPSEENAPWKTLTRILQPFGRSCKSLTN